MRRIRLSTIQFHNIEILGVKHTYLVTAGEKSTIIWIRWESAEIASKGGNATYVGLLGISIYVSFSVCIVTSLISFGVGKQYGSTISFPCNMILVNSSSVFGAAHQILCNCQKAMGKYGFWCIILQHPFADSFVHLK